MSQTLASLPMLVEIFALLFSNRWVARWQQQWPKQPRTSQASPGHGRHVSRISGKKRQKHEQKPPSAPRRFYQRIF